MSFNKVILQGNLTRDPEVRTMPSGSTIARLGLAVNRTYADKDGNRKEEVTFVDVDAFGKQAEVLARFFTKGRPILIEGRLKLDQWTDKTTGEKKSRLGVVLEGFSFVDSAKSDDARSEADVDRAMDRAAAPATRAPRQPATPSAAPGPEDEDVPF